MLGFHCRLCCLAFSLLFAACGSKNDTALGRQNNTPAPRIVTTSVKEALKGELYSQPLAATGGSAPLVWSLPAEPKEIPWLTIDSSNGALSGTPSDALVLGKSFVVQVKDHDGRADQKTFTLIVRECTTQNEGATFPCHINSDDACIAGTRTCSGGQLGECTVGSGSTSTDYCGSSCLACGTSADTCNDGRCRCGAEDPCGTTDTTKPDCCTETSGSVCTNLQSDPKHCGHCDTACDPESLHVLPTCVGGTCVTPAPCQQGYARCPLGSNAQSCLTETVSDPTNCGGCGHSCQKDYGDNNLSQRHATLANPPCQGGQCKITCTDGAQNCNGDFFDGCECTPPIDGNATCGGDGKTCTYVCDKVTEKNVLCGIPSLNGGALTCIESTKYVQCTPNDPRSCTTNDMNNCGACGRVCQAPTGGSAKCVNNSCIQSCPTHQTVCNGACCAGTCHNAICCANWCGLCCPPAQCVPRPKDPGEYYCRP